MQQKITIKQIAEMAGVSRGSVDRVLHNRGNVSPEIKKKIDTVLQEINYQPNISASLLARNSSFEILVIIPKSDEDSYWELPAQGIKEGVEKLSHYPIKISWLLFRNDKVASFEKVVKTALVLKPDAILLAPVYKTESQRFIKAIKQKQIPIITINTQLGVGSTVPYVGQDSYQSGIIAGRLYDLLIPDLKNLLITNLGSNTQNAQHVMSKEAGLRHYFSNRANMKINTIEIDNFDDVNQVKQLVAQQVDFKTQGIFVTNSRTYKLVNAVGHEIQSNNIKIIGYDLIKPNVKLLKDGVISFLLNQNPKKQGLRAVEMLIQKLLFKQKLPGEAHLPIDVVMKENCDYFYKA